MALEAQANERWQEIQKYWRLEDYRWLYALVGFLAACSWGALPGITAPCHGSPARHRNER